MIEVALTRNPCDMELNELGKTRYQVGSSEFVGEVSRGNQGFLRCGIITSVAMRI